VIAIGSPFEHKHSVTAGIVSAKGRKVGIIASQYAYEKFIQTDAAINPGNSGGPLINLDGKIVGVNTAIASRSGGYNGIGFAIPVNMARQVMRELIDQGKITRGLLGVIITSVNHELQKEFDLPSDQGALVNDVVINGPAENAGIKRGDVIIAFNNEDIKDSDILREKVAMTRPDLVVPVKVIRNGNNETIKVKIGRQPTDEEGITKTAKIGNQWGLEVQDLIPGLAGNLGLKKTDPGVIVSLVETGSPAERVGIRPGTLIMEIKRVAINNTVDYQKEMAKNQKSKTLLLLVKQGRTTQYLVLEREE